MLFRSERRQRRAPICRTMGRMQYHYIANAAVASSAGRTIAVIDPSDGQPYDEIQRGTGEDIDAAVCAAACGHADLALYHLLHRGGAPLPDSTQADRAALAALCPKPAAEETCPLLPPQDPTVTLSVIVPVYNGEATIGPCLDSILQQETSCTVQLIVVPDDRTSDLGDYVRLEDESKEPLPLRDGDVYLSKSSQLVLGIQPGDTAHVQDSSLNVAKVKVSDISLNYLGNTLYMTQGTYERAFGRSARLNGVFVLLKGSSADQIAFSKKLKSDGWLTISSTAEHWQNYEANFTIINSVVVLVTFMAACLSFVVVFTLSNTNISERERELARTRQPPRGVLQLANMLRAQAARRGCYQSPQPFHPHITLLREARHAVPIPPPGFSWTFAVSEFVLYESRFSRGRTRYTALERYPFNKES